MQDPMRFYISDPDNILCDALRATIDENTKRGQYVSCSKRHPSDSDFVVEGVNETELRQHLISLKEPLRRISFSLEELPPRAKKRA